MHHNADIKNCILKDRRVNKYDKMAQEVTKRMREPFNTGLIETN